MREPKNNNDQKADMEAPSSSELQQKQTESFLQSSISNISAPRGGGTIKGMGEKFNVNAVTGTGSITIPILASASREGLAPQLSLNYDTGSGNSEFGLGWSLSGLSTITRRTSQQLPKYEDESDSDVFVLSGVEDLVPVFRKDVSEQSDTPKTKAHLDLAETYVASKHGKFRVRNYRPRIEGLFSRIERWTDLADVDNVYWKMIAGDGTVTLVGATDASRVFDVDPISGKKRIFSWLVQEQYDLRGNAMLFTYKADDSIGVPRDAAHEQNRTELSRSHQRYLKSVKYGNRRPNRNLESWDSFSPSDLAADAWMFALVFDFGEHDEHDPLPDETNQWKLRKDPFSRYQSGFEVRTYRLCRRILMFHHFVEELKTPDYLVSALELTYTEGPAVSFLSSATRAGFVRRDNRDLSMSTAGLGPYNVARLPSLDFEYQHFPDAERLGELSPRWVDEESLENLPSGGMGSSLWVDLYGEGLSGIFTEQNDLWYYKRSAPSFGQDGLEAKFSPVEIIPNRPSFQKAHGLSFSDVSGRSQPDVVQMSGSVKGFYRLESASGPVPSESWSPFQPFRSWPTIIDMKDPRLIQFDFTGNGLADLVVFENETVTWYECLGDEGFSGPKLLSLPQDENASPKMVFKDRQQSVFLGDLSGDGLVDLIHVRNGDIAYWPNVGSQFGAKVTMSNSPFMDSDVEFSPSRLLLGDVDGSGTADLIYLRDDELHIYLNQAGNAWSSVMKIKSVPPINELSFVASVDILGCGTTSFVWSTIPVGLQQSRMHYLDFTNGLKPHIMSKISNNLGKEVRLQYKPSTAFYLADKERGKPWITRLPFPVQCLENVVTIDHVSQTKYTERRAYHHGHYDTVEREFRGFGHVEQWDVEEYSQTSAIGDSYSLPAIHTKQWFHTGAFTGNETLSNLFSEEYYGANAMLLEVFPTLRSMGSQEFHEASRSLKGKMLREEIYADDETSKSGVPYEITENGNSFVLLQPLGENKHAVFLPLTRETITHNCERDFSDPRISHRIVLEVDDFGNTLKSVAISYGRRRGKTTLTDPLDVQRQQTTRITLDENQVTNAINTMDSYRTPVPFSSSSYEIAGLEPRSGKQFLEVGDFMSSSGRFLDIPEVDDDSELSSSRLAKRLLTRSLSRYRSDDLDKLLDLGMLEPMGLKGAVYKLAYTSKHLDSYAAVESSQFRDLFTSLGRDGGYTTFSGNRDLYTKDATIRFTKNPSESAANELLAARKNFYQPQSLTDAFGNTHTFNYDRHNLHVIQIKDPLGSITESIMNYRTLAPEETIDINRNHTKVRFDALGMVVAVARMGKLSSTDPAADGLEGIQENLTQAQIDAYLVNPESEAASLLKNATERFIYNYRSSDNSNAISPICFSTLKKEKHGNANDKIHIAFSYLNGLGRTVQSKAFAGPDPETSKARWVCSGWVVLNNQGHPVQSFEPFFDNGHRFQFNKRVGVSSYTIYDALGRKVSLLHAAKHWTKSIIHPWKLEGWDPIDTLLLNPSQDEDIGHAVSALPEFSWSPTWYKARADGSLGKREQDAAQKSVALAGTPMTVHLDALGATFMQENSLGGGAVQKSRTLTDIEGRLLETINGRGTIVVKNSYDKLGRPIHTQSVDAGDLWQLHDANGTSIASIDNKKRILCKKYDALRREVESLLYEPEQPPMVVNRVVYGESLGTFEEQIQQNSRGKAKRTFDQSGIITVDLHDFDGNVASSTQQLVKEYKKVIDWGADKEPELEPRSYLSTATYDAMGRIMSCVEADGTVKQSTYNYMGLVESVKAVLYGALSADRSPVWTTLVNSIAYDAAGRKVCSTLGNGAKTTNTYDTYTKKLIRRVTVARSGLVQDLDFVYDPLGNVISSRDNAQQDIFFRNAKVSPEVDYEYDALYRLVKATGREHLGQTCGAASGPGRNEMSPNQGLDARSDGKVMGQYTESYSYDLANNILSLTHDISGSRYPSWTRDYSYAEPSQITPTQMGDKLSSTKVGRLADTYKYDSSGLMTSMPHLSMMQWDFQNRLVSSSQQIVSDDSTPETTWYVYNTAGERIRKVTERQSEAGEAPRKLEERITVGPTELYHKYHGDGETVKLQCLSQKVIEPGRDVLVLAEDWTGSDDAPGLLLRYPLVNIIQSVGVELDDTGQIISYEEYSPYGTSTYQLLLSKVPKRFRFSGKEQDSSNGMYYFGLRYYAAWLGRWISPDPTGISDSLNVFEYAHSNPLSNRDPDGAGITFSRPQDPGDPLLGANPRARGASEAEVARFRALNIPPEALTDQQMYKFLITEGRQLMLNVGLSTFFGQVLVGNDEAEAKVRDYNLDISGDEGHLAAITHQRTSPPSGIGVTRFRYTLDTEQRTITNHSEVHAAGENDVPWHIAVFYDWSNLCGYRQIPLHIDSIRREDLDIRETYKVLRHAQRNHSGTKGREGKRHTRTYTLTDERESDTFYALLGTPEGRAAAMLLMAYNNPLGRLTIASITIIGKVGHHHRPPQMVINFAWTPYSPVAIYSAGSAPATQFYSSEHHSTVPEYSLTEPPG